MRKDSLSAVQENVKPELKARDEDPNKEPDQSQEVTDVREVVDVPVGDAITDSSLQIKEAGKERRRLSFQPMDESSASEFSPSPSPQVQRRRLKITSLSSSSEDIKTESAESSAEDEEFIRQQIMGMGGEEEMSLSEDEKDRKLTSDEAGIEVGVDNAEVTSQQRLTKVDTDNEDQLARRMSQPRIDAAITQDVPETAPSTVIKKATPVTRMRASTDEDAESITESLSKGSSSVHASSFTPENSHTSASSLEEDSDSSPSHKKVDKHHRKAKHRQPGQTLPTIADSSEEDEVKEEREIFGDQQTTKEGDHVEKRISKKSRKDKDEFKSQRKHAQSVSTTSYASPFEDTSHSDDFQRSKAIGEANMTTSSENCSSIEHEPDATVEVQTGSKPSPTVIPMIPADQPGNIFIKHLKSADEVYEDIILKSRAIPGDSPPSVEPLYEGMTIEDYLYESLVVEPELVLGDAQQMEQVDDTSFESVKKLRSPEDVYEEMMQKKRELMMIEQEFQQAQTAMESSTSDTSINVPSPDVESCVVTIITEQPTPPDETERIIYVADYDNDLTVKKKKRPAPPRPSAPPKRVGDITEMSSVPTAPTGIGFVRPMTPQDPALRKSLFPIPDLKITQCSSTQI